jgi:predicted permease
MDKLIGVIKMVLPVLLMLPIGMLCHKTGIIKKEGAEGLKSLVVNITLPAVLFKAFYSTTYTISTVIITITMFLVCLAALGIGFAFKRVFRSPMRSTPFLLTGYEAGMLGYALYTLLFGANKIASFAMVDLGQVLFVFTVFLSMLKKGEGVSFKTSLLSIIKSPVIAAIVLGVIVGATGLGALIGASPAGGIVSYVFEFIAAPTAVVILFVVGYELRLSRKGLRRSLAVVLARFIIMSLLGAAVLFGFSALMPMSDALKWAFVLMFMLPPPYVLPVFVADENEGAFVSTSLSLSTLLSLAAFAVIAVLV